MSICVCVYPVYMSCVLFSYIDMAFVDGRGSFRSKFSKYLFWPLTLSKTDIAVHDLLTSSLFVYML